MNQGTVAANNPDQEVRKGQVLLVQPEEIKTYWQPKPANGHASVIISPAMVQMDARFSVGTQTLPPGGVVREHSHDHNEEVLHFTSGSGKAYLDGVEHRLKKGQTLFLGKKRLHTFINDGDEDLSWVWFFTPNGLEDFFRDIGRLQVAGEAMPPPFERPSDVAEIEARTVFSIK